MIPAAISIFLTLFVCLFSSPLFAQYGTMLCKQDSDFSCYRVKRGDSWVRLFPRSSERDLIMRINRMNTPLYPGLILAIPNENMNLMDIAPFAKQIDPPGEKVIFVSINNLAWGAYDSAGSLVNWGPTSSARGYCPDLHRSCHTIRGQFNIYRKQGAGCISTKFPIGRGGAPMPYCMFFYGGFALHGSYNVPGYNDSHGCIRMFIDDARWLNQEFVGDDEVPVVIQK